jgi:hypothetical protein
VDNAGTGRGATTRDVGGKLVDACLMVVELDGWMAGTAGLVKTQEVAAVMADKV